MTSSTSLITNEAATRGPSGGFDLMSHGKGDFINVRYLHSNTA